MRGANPVQGSNDYQREHVRGEQNVRVIDSIREVDIEGPRSDLNAAAGGVVGGVAGSTNGQGKGV